MIVTEKEYQKLFKEINGMTFTPKANLVEEEKEVDGENVKEFKYEILKNADEVYQEYLNPPVSQPTTEEKQVELINNLILDNLNMQVQIDSLIASNLGGN